MGTQHVLVVCAILAGTAAESATRLPLGTYLLSNDALLDSSSMVNTSLGLGNVIKDYDRPSIVPEYPWEGQVGFYTSALTCAPNQSLACGANGYFAIYYQCMPHSLEHTAGVPLCFANSTDGITWFKPMLPFFIWNGSGVGPSTSAEGQAAAQVAAGVQTNIVFVTNDTMSDPGSVFIDTAPGVPASELFKLTYEGSGMDRQLYMATSPDGLAWAMRDPLGPIITTIRFSDTQTAMVVHNTDDGGSGTVTTWTAFGRDDATFDNDTSACLGAYASTRRVMAAVSNASAAGPFSTPVDVLTNVTGDIPGCLDNYNSAPSYLHGMTFFLISNFWHFSVNESGADGLRNRINDGIQDIRLAYTAAVPPVSGIDFHASHGPFIPRGVGYRDPVSGAYNVSGSDLDAGFVFATSGGLLDPDVLSPPASSRTGGTGGNGSWPFPFTSPSPWVQLLYWGAQWTHTGGGHMDYPDSFQGVLRAKMRREGFVKLSTPDGDPWSLASFLTVPLLLPDPAAACPGMTNPSLWLLLNAQTSVGGYVAVEARDATTGQPIPGYTFNDAVALKGNAVRAPVGWLMSSTSEPTGHGVVDPPVTPPTTHGLEVPSQHGNRALVLAFNMKHAALYAWDLQCVVGSDAGSG